MRRCCHSQCLCKQTISYRTGLLRCFHVVKYCFDSGPVLLFAVVGVGLSSSLSPFRFAHGVRGAESLSCVLAAVVEFLTASTRPRDVTSPRWTSVLTYRFKKRNKLLHIYVAPIFFFFLFLLLFSLIFLLFASTVCPQLNVTKKRPESKVRIKMTFFIWVKKERNIIYSMGSDSLFNNNKNLRQRKSHLGNDLINFAIII